MIDLSEDLRGAYTLSVERANRALSGLIESHEADRNPALAHEYDDAMDSYVQQSQRLESVLRETPGAEDVENALGNAAFIDLLLGLRSLLVVPDDVTPNTPFQGTTGSGLRARLHRHHQDGVADGVEWIRANEVSDELVDAALTGRLPRMPEDLLLGDLSEGLGPHGDAGVETIRGAFGLVLRPAAGTLTDAATDMALDLGVVSWAHAAGVLTDNLAPLIRTLQEIDLHALRVLCRKWACACLQRLLGKLGAGTRELLDRVGEVLGKVKTALTGAFEGAFQAVLSRPLTKANQRQVRFTVRGGIPKANCAAMVAAARTKHRRSWEVTGAVAKFGIPIGVACANLFALAGVPVAAVLFLALAGVESALLDRVLAAIVDAAGEPPRPLLLQ
ncbi:hypothetical protein [Specibacter cremeus]|uniref:hypothetical protein n=1 Tax=Specibacter cremeus TaxID=1629051 RepID=UPI000F773C77|nr:hypothetical protein [Specibacter cremeus]